MLPLWEAAPPRAACRAAADARAHAFDQAMPPVQGVRQELRCERHLVSGCGSPQLEACRVQKAAANWLARRICRDAAFGSGGRRGLPHNTTSEAAVRADHAVTAEADNAARRNLYCRTRKAAIVGRSAPQQVLHTPSAVTSAVKRRPRSARNKAARASRQKTPREALAITPSARASRAQNHGRL